MSNLQRGSVGTQQCINAVSYLDGLIGDIDTTVMFAHAGTLDPEDDKQFPEHKENILNNAQKLLIDTKALVASAQQSQEQLAGSVTEVLKSSTKLIDSVKLGSSALGIEDKNGQVCIWFIKHKSYVMLYAIWYHLYNLKNVKSTHEGVLLLVKLQAKACNFTKSNTLP